MILKKKGLIIGTLAVLLILTGYFNHIYNQNALKSKDDTVLDSEKEKFDISIKDASDDEIKLEDEEEKEANNSVETSTKGFFKDFRYDRENTRKKEVEYIKNIIDNPNSEDETKMEAQNQLIELTNIMEKELGVEGLIKAKGFNDAVVILQDTSVNVVVDKKELSPEEVAQILDIVKRETGQPADNIKIIPRS